MIVSSREKDLGGFAVRRILPYVSRRMVGPFIFFDHMGPAEFQPGQGMDVRPHPHINLATVTYLFEGKIRHRDSLGSDQVIEPGAVNWMTAGRGIVHSERSPEDVMKSGGKMNGIQCWVALPDEHEKVAPQFTHHPSETLPQFQVQKVQMKLLLGEAFGKKSPVPVHSNLFYLEAQFPEQSLLHWPEEEREIAFYVVSGKLKIGDFEVTACNMFIPEISHPFEIQALEKSHVMIVGGSPIGPRKIYWNFVSSSEERLEEAKLQWASGPGQPGSRFALIPGDDQEHIPLPDSPNLGLIPKGTIM